MPQSRPWCFSSVWPVVHHTEWSPECLTCLVPLSTALSSESLRSNSPPEDPRTHGGRAGLKIDVVFLMLNLNYVVKSCKRYFQSVPILGFWGPYAKLCRRPGGGGVGGVEEWMKRICPCYTPSRIALAEGAQETVSLRGTLSARFFLFFVFQTRDCTTSTLQYFYIESVTAHHIKINDHSCFHNSWPNSKSKLKLKHL